MFDYIFFSVYNFYQSKNSDMSDEFATNYVSMIQSLLILFILPVISIFKNFRELATNFEVDFGFDFKFLVLIPIIVIMFFNHKKYKINYKKKGYKNIEKRTFKSPIFGLLMIVLPLLIIFSIIVLERIISKN